MGRGASIDANASGLIRNGYVTVTDCHGTEWIINQDRIYFIEIPSHTDTMFTVHGFGKNIVLEFESPDDATEALADLISPAPLPSSVFL